VSGVRPEHARLLRGQGRYLDDIEPAGCLHMAFLRSSLANARIAAIDTSEAAAQPGVELVLTAADLGALDRPLPLLRDHPSVPHARTQHPLAGTVVSHVGQPLALVVARTRYEAEDAAELIDVDYEPLDAVVDVETAALGEHLVHEDVPLNLAGEMRQAKGDPDRAFAEAPHRERLKLRIERSAGMPMETRGVLADWDPQDRGLQVWDSTQNPVAIHHGLARLFGLSDDRVRVVAPDVGGGFGTKIMMFYPEEVLVPHAAMRLGRPVKWVEDRWEHMVSAHQERAQVHDAEVAFDDTGRILAVRTDFVHDMGAFAPYGPGVPEVTVTHVLGQYRVEHYAARCRMIYTNTPCVTPYRGAGRPQAVFVMERLIGAVARRLGLEPLEVRRRNLIPKDLFPYDVGLEVLGTPVIYDSGDYQAAFDRMDESLPLAEFRETQRREREAGRLLGIGFGTYIEGSAPGPYETARCALDGSGQVTVIVSTPSQGQSHKTVFGDLAARILGVEPERVRVIAGDSARMATGSGTYGSRAAVVAGNAVADAAKTLRRQIAEHVAALYEADPADVVIEAGRAGIAGSPDTFHALADLASSRNPMPYAAEPAGAQRLRELAAARPRPAADGAPPIWPAFQAEGQHVTTTMTYGSGVHGAVVEVDPETGAVKVLDYAVVDDCGTVLDKDVVRGQVHGGVVQGLGGALLERLVFDSSGQPQTTSFMDFLLPTIEDIPVIRVESIETPSPLNPLGVKGVGEAGVIAVSAVIAEAVEDALSQHGVVIDAMPLDPEQVLDLATGSATHINRTQGA
jgi:CO/xanthine dehydrogenase Mo-binding subunit